MSSGIYRYIDQAWQALEVAGERLNALAAGDGGLRLVLLMLIAAALSVAVVGFLKSLKSRHAPKFQESKEYIDAVAWLEKTYAKMEARLHEHRYIADSEARAMEAKGDTYDWLMWRKWKLPRDMRARLDKVEAWLSYVVPFNREFVQKELELQKEFFDKCTGSYPLDDQQREACVVDEDAALVVAGAGSGKTSTIMAKVIYLTQKRNVKPEEILLISFTNKAAEEMTGRIRQATGLEIRAMTFHKLGLELYKQLEAKRFDIAEDDFVKRTIHKCLTGEDGMANDVYEKIVNYFAYYFNSAMPETAEEDIEVYARSVQSRELRQLKNMVYDIKESTSFRNERMKSLEEVLIANYLFMHGIEYEYEKKYDKPYEQNGLFRDYHPDFYLPGYDIWLEHYAVNEHGEPPKRFGKIECRKYKAGMVWKRNLHKQHGNRYIETFSWWNQKGFLLERLEETLKANGVEIKQADYQEIWRQMKARMTQLSEFEKLLAAFIGLFKSNGWGREKFDELRKLDAGSRYATKRQRQFLNVAEPVYLRYEETLRNEGRLDFNDMINVSAHAVANAPDGMLAWKYIIVDEYQDASVSRARLVKAIKENSGAHIFCVGDDWQSIYRFAGSDISLFTEFGREFGFFRQLKIENTYRNSQELIDVMGSFVLANPAQIKKTLKANKHNGCPIVPVMYPKNDTGFDDALAAAIGMIADAVKGREATVLLLGRFNMDANRLKTVRQILAPVGHDEYRMTKHPNLAFRFMTVHKAKGLEGDYAIVLNMDSGLFGFPSAIEDDPLLQLVLTKPDEYEFAEERRVFYVAMTRTKNVVYLLTPESGGSSFVDELFGIGVNDAVLVKGCHDKDSVVVCPQCGKGVLERKSSKHGEYMQCSYHPFCSYKTNQKVDKNTPRCPKCNSFLVYRINRKDKSGFLGCSNYPYCRYAAPLPDDYAATGEPQQVIGETTFSHFKNWRGKK